METLTGKITEAPVEIILIVQHILDHSGVVIEIIPTGWFELSHPKCYGKQYLLNKLPEDVAEYVLKHNRCIVDPSSVSDLLELLGEQ